MKNSTLNSPGVDSTQCVLKTKPIQDQELLDGTNYEGEITGLTGKVVVSSSEDLNAGDDFVREKHGKGQKC